MNIAFIIICIIILVIVSILTTFNYNMDKKMVESFQEDQQDQHVNIYNPGEEPVQSNRLFYFKIGLANFFTQQDKVNSFSDENFIEWIKKRVYIWPTAQDLCCKTLEKGNGELDCSCDKINIMNSTCQDTSFKHVNEKSLNSIESSIGATKKENCSMTIFENDYHLVKRSISVQIHEPVKQIGIGNNKKYRLVLKGNVIPFILSRPLFISFNTSGLYQVIHDSVTNISLTNEYDDPKRSNALSYLDSTYDTQVVYLYKISHQPIHNLQVYNETYTNIYKMYNKPNMSIPLTLYYLNYKSEIKTYDTDAHAVNIIINNKTYNDAFRSSNNLQIVTGKDDTSLFSNIELKKDTEGKLVFSLDNGSEQLEYNLPSEFTYYDPNEYEKFDICYSLIYDILLIYCFASKKNTRKNICYAMRFHLPRKLEIKKDTLVTTLKEQTPDIYYYMKNNLKDIMNITCIPNYSQLAYKLGYVFNMT